MVPIHFSSALDYSRRGFTSFLEQAKIVCQDGEGFQKVCLCALSIFQWIDCFRSVSLFPKLVRKLDIANALDFYGFLKIPHYCLRPYHIDKIHPQKTLDQLVDSLCTCWGRGSVGSEGTGFDPEVIEFAREALEGYFSKLSDNDIFCKDEAMFKSGLCLFMARKIAKEGLQWPVAKINLDHFHPAHYSFSLYHTITTTLFTSVDIACGAYFLQEWNLLDLVRRADRIGEYRAFCWVPNQSLDDWIRGGLCVGFILQAVKSLRSWMKSPQYSDARKRYAWDMAVATTEFVFNLSVLLRYRPSIIYFLTAVAKGVGVVSIIYQPSKQYFSPRA